MEISQSKNNTPEFSLTIKASIDAVWQALRDKKLLLEWHGWDTPGLEEEIENIYFTDVKEDTADELKRTLVVYGGDAFVLEAEGNTTKLTLVRAGLSGDTEWDAYYDNISEGWISFIEQLRFLLERAPKTARQTSFASKSLNRDEVTEQLQLTDEQEGTHFAGRFQDEKLSGEVWFSTENQLGLAINEWGSGLLIIQFSENGCISTVYK